jgi:hypothetical protein
MPELTINPDEIAAALRKHVESFTPSLEQAQVGRVLEVGDGIARVAGLPDTSVNEVLEFEGGILGLALNLDEESIGAVVLGSASHIEEGGAVKGTGRILSIPVGDAMIGRVVNGLGQAIDGKGPINTHESRRLEVQAPGIVGRAAIRAPESTRNRVGSWPNPAIPCNRIFCRRRSVGVALRLLDEPRAPQQPPQPSNEYMSNCRLSPITLSKSSPKAANTGSATGFTCFST